ncbi:MAG: tetratricopeptide repeat protein [Chloroflexi bacterium]|nr:tetratricopeptide repeat protein [Chloroflexota bacterium]
MNKRRTKPNWFRIILLSLLVLAAAYVNRFVVADIQPLGVPTPTATISPETLVAEAEALFKEGKLLPAIDAYQKAIVSRPDDPATHIMLARTLVFAGKYKEAQTAAEDALLLNPSNSMASAVRAWALNFQGDYLQAENEILRALELDPNNALAHAYYVEILVDSYYSGIGAFDAVEKAIEESKVAQALAPDLLETHRARGYILGSDRELRRSHPRVRGCHCHQPQHRRPVYRHRTQPAHPGDLQRSGGLLHARQRAQSRRPHAGPAHVPHLCHAGRIRQSHAVRQLRGDGRPRRYQPARQSRRDAVLQRILGRGGGGVILCGQGRLVEGRRAVGAHRTDAELPAHRGVLLHLRLRALPHQPMRRSLADRAVDHLPRPGG